MMNKKHMTVWVHDIPVELGRWMVHWDGMESLEWRQVENGLRTWLLLRLGCTDVALWGCAPMLV